MSSLATLIAKSIADIEATPDPTPEQVRRYEEQQRQERQEALRAKWDAFTKPMGKRYRDCSLSSFITTPRSEATLLAIREYGQELKDRVTAGQGIVLFGPSGTGKDHLLVGLCRVAIGKGLSIRWLNGCTLYRSMRDNMGQDEEELVNRLVRPEVLYLSDPTPPIGNLTSFQASTLFAIIDGRYRDQKATWVSLNVQDGKEAESRLGAAIVDRLRDGALSLHCCWESHRKACHERKAT